MNILTDCTVLWLDKEDIDETDLALNIRHHVVHSLFIFTNVAECSSFMLYCTSGTRLLLLVVRDCYYEEILRRTLMLLPSTVTLFVYVLYHTRYCFHWKRDNRIRAIFHVTEEQRIVEQLRDDLHRHLEQRWSSGFCLFDAGAQRQSALDKLSNENAKFMWFHLLMEVLLRIPVTTQSKNDLLEQCFLAYASNLSMQKQIHQFIHDYQAKEAFHWYTKDSFLFRLLNQACRTDDIDLLVKFRFFIRDLHEQLTMLYHAQRATRASTQLLTVYRGTFVSRNELALLSVPSADKKVIWFKTFVSTSCEKQTAERFRPSPSHADEVSVLVEIVIDDSIDMSAAPFADIHELSAIGDELEILMSMGTAFELDSIEENDEHVWQMRLRMVNGDDRVRHELRRCLQEEIGEETSLVTLAKLLLWIGDYTKAAKYNQILLAELPSDDPDRAPIYNNLGYTYQKMNQPSNALHCLNTSIELYLRPGARDRIYEYDENLACAYNNKGLALVCLGDYQTAAQCIGQSLQLRQDDPSLDEKRRNWLAVKRSYCHENLGLLYTGMSSYDLALHHLQTTLDIRNETLPSNHYMIAQVYNNLSRVYLLMSNFSSQMFERIEQALTKQIQALRDDHPHRGTMYNTLGEAYYSHNQYSLAFSCFETALHIYQSARTRDALREAIAFSNMGTVMKAQENFDGALHAFLRALPICEGTAPHHPNVARCLINIGMAYSGKEDQSNALVYFQRGLRFCQLHLTDNHDMTAMSYSSLASVLDDSHTDLALDYCQRAINIYNHMGLPNQINAIRCHEQRGCLYRKRADPHSALACYEQALVHCRQASLPQRHSLWVQIYMSRACVYCSMNEYQRELEQYENALQHVPDESVELPRIYKAMDVCRQRIMDVDVRQTITLMLDKLD